MPNGSKPPRMLFFAAFVVIVAAMKLGRDLIAPFALAFLLSFLLAPLVGWFEKLRMGRVTAVIAAVLLTTAVTGLFGWVLFGQMVSVVDSMPQHSRQITEKFEKLRDSVGSRIDRASKTVEALGAQLTDSREASSSTVKVDVVEKPDPFKGIGGGMGVVLDVLNTAGIVALLAIVILLKREDFRERFIGLAGGTNIYRTTQAMDEGLKKISKYLVMQTIINGIHGVLVAIGLWLLGLPNAPLWGLLSAVLRFIPYVGPWIAAVFPIMLSVAMFPGWLKPLEVIGFILLLELGSNNILEPLLYGSGTGVSPAAILFSVVFWTWLWGPIGLVLATPLTVVVAVMGKYVPGLGFLSALLGEKPAIDDGARLYQRLLTGDIDGASDVVEPVLAAKPLVTAYDETVLPALRLAAEDRHRPENAEPFDRRLVASVRDLIDDMAERSAPKNAPKSAPDAGAEAAFVLRVACLPTRDTLDEAAATMFVRAAALEGVDAEVASSEALASSRVELAAERAADVVLISDLSTSPTLRRVRYLAKKLAQRLPKTPVIVGLWNTTIDTAELRHVLGVENNVYAVRSVAEALAQTLQIREAVRLLPERQPRPRATEKPVAT